MTGDSLQHLGHHVVDVSWYDLIDGQVAPRRDWFVLEHHTGDCPHPSRPHLSPTGARAEIDRCYALREVQA